MLDKNHKNSNNVKNLKNNRNNFYDLVFISQKINSLSNLININPNSTSHVMNKTPEISLSNKKNKTKIFTKQNKSYFNADFKNGKNLKYFFSTQVENIDIKNHTTYNKVKLPYNILNKKPYTVSLTNYTNNESCINNISFLKFLQNSNKKTEDKFYNNSYMNEIRNIDDISDYYINKLNLSSEEKLNLKNCIVLQILNSSTTTLNLGDIGVNYFLMFRKYKKKILIQSKFLLY